MKGAWTSSTKEPDPLEDDLSDLVRAAQDDIDASNYEDDMESSEDVGELIEGAEAVSFILMVPGCRLREFSVRATETELSVEGPEFELRRTLRCRVDPSSLKTRCNNGVLSIRIAKST